MVDSEICATTAEIVEDIRLRMIHAPDIVGDDRRALPPVDWARIEREEQEQAEWEQQFEENVRKESLTSRFVKRLSGQ